MNVQEKMEFVKRDFQNCWRHTLNRDNFDSNIYFEDPISKYTNYIGILSNILATCMHADMHHTQSSLILSSCHLQAFACSTGAVQVTKPTLSFCVTS